MINIEIFNSGSHGNLYLVENEDTKILLECGVDKTTLITKLYKSKKINVSKLDACLITHCHSDHYNIDTIKYINNYISIYANKGVYEKHPFKGFLINDEDKFTIGSIRIKAIKVEHGRTENMAFIFKDKDDTYFFGTDFAYTTKNLSAFKFTGIYLEVNYVDYLLEEFLGNTEEEYKTKYIRQINTHQSLDNAIKFLQHLDLSECKEIIAIHQSLDCGDREIIKETISEVFDIPCYVARKDGGC